MKEISLKEIEKQIEEDKKEAVKIQALIERYQGMSAKEVVEEIENARPKCQTSRVTKSGELGFLRGELHMLNRSIEKSEEYLNERKEKEAKQVKEIEESDQILLPTGEVGSAQDYLKKLGIVI